MVVSGMVFLVPLYATALATDEQNANLAGLGLDEPNARLIRFVTPKTHVLAGIWYRL